MFDVSEKKSGYVTKSYVVALKQLHLVWVINTTQFALNNSFVSFLHGVMHHCRVAALKHLGLVLTRPLSAARTLHSQHI